MDLLDRIRLLTGVEENERETLTESRKDSMKIRSQFLLVTLFMALAAGTGRCADVKIGVVDMARLVKAHPDTPSADALLEKQLEEFQAEQKDMEDEFDKLKKAFDEARKEAGNKALSEEAREEKMQAAEEKLTAVRDYDRKVRETMGARQKQLSEQSLRMRKRIVEKIQEAVREYAAGKGFTVMLDSAALSVSGVEILLYASDKIDVTEDLLKVIGKSKASDVKVSETKSSDVKAEPKVSETKETKAKASEAKE
jgi:outer membrane protein